MANLRNVERGADITMTVFPPTSGVGNGAFLTHNLPAHVYLPKTMMLNGRTTQILLGILHEMAKQGKGRI